MVELGGGIAARLGGGGVWSVWTNGLLAIMKFWNGIGLDHDRTEPRPTP